MFEKIKLIITIKELIKILNKNFSKTEEVIQGSTEELKSEISNLDEKVDTNYNELVESIDNEATARENADIILQTNIDNLTTTVQENYSELEGSIESLTEIVDTNKTDSENRDIALGERIDNLKTEIESGFATKEELENLDSSLSKDIDDLDTKLSDEIESLNTITSDLQTDLGTLEENLDSYKESNDKVVSDLSQTVQNNYSTLDKKIDGVDTRLTEVAEEINQTIEDNVVALQQEDTALQNQINTHSQQITKEISDRTQADTALNNRITEVAEDLNATIEENVTALQQADTNLQSQITTNKNDISDLTQTVQDDYEELKGLIEQETSDRSSADTTLQNNINAEAKTRKDTDDSLQDQIDNLSARGHYLSTWDATIGLAGTNPPSSPYTYKSGDYFIVGKVGETNYRPNGTQYTTGVPSIEVETEELAVDDTYIFDGTTWHLQINHGKTVSFANLAGEPSDNTNLKNVLDSKQPVGDYALDDSVVHKANEETITGKKIFTGGSGSSSSDVSLQTKNALAVGDETQTAYTGIYNHRKCGSSGVNTAGFLVNSDGSAKFTHKKGTATAIGTADDSYIRFDSKTLVYSDSSSATSEKDILHTGNAYNKTSIDNLLSNKQDVISNLSIIESNAQAGKDAKDTIDTYGDIVTHNANEFQLSGDYATKIELSDGLSSKQDTINDLEQIRTNAQAGANLVTQVGTNTTDIGDLKLNKADKDELPSKLSDLEDDITDTLGSELDYTGTTLSLLNGQGNVLSSATIKSTPDLDETTITLNSENKLQSIGNILQSGSYQKYWEGSKAQYNAIETKDPNTLYQVLDDEEHALFEVDGTSIEFNDDNILQIPQNVDYGIQEQTWGDGESGYTLHRNGKLEQWGVATTSANGEVEFTMHTEFRDLNFSVFIEPREQGDFFHYAIPSGTKKFRCRTKGANGYIMGIKIQWRAYGYYK